MRLFLAVYLLLYFGIVFIWRPYQAWKRTGINPYVLDSTDSAYNFIRKTFRLIVVATAFVVFMYIFDQAWYVYLTPITWLERSTVTIMGTGLLLVSLVWIVVVQVQLGNAWRTAIELRTADLVQTEVFYLSLSPSSLGMRIHWLGLFLVLPNAVTFTIWVVGEMLVLVDRQIDWSNKQHPHPPLG